MGEKLTNSNPNPNPNIHIDTDPYRARDQTLAFDNKPAFLKKKRLISAARKKNI